MNQPPTTSPTTTAASAPTGVTFDITDLDDGQHVYAAFTVTDHYGTGLKSGYELSAQEDTVSILKLAATRYPDAVYYHVAGYRTGTDDYGNTARRAVLSVGYARATVERINFKNVEPVSIWRIRDNGPGMLG